MSRASYTFQAPELTNESYWDSWWKSVPIELVGQRDPQHGQRGYFLKAIERHAGSLKGKSVLEIGGAFSQHLAAMARYRDVKAAIVDYSRDGIDASRRFFDAYGCEVESIHSDVFALSGRQFDLVTHWGVLEHQVDPLPLLAKCTELARETIIFTMPEMRGFSGWLWKKLSPQNYARHVYHDDNAVFSAFNKLNWKARAFSWGQPFFYMQTGNNRGFLHTMLYDIQAVIDKAAYLGLPYDRGMRYVSQHRGFVAKPTQDRH